MRSASHLASEERQSGPKNKVAIAGYCCPNEACEYDGIIDEQITDSWNNDDLPNSYSNPLSSAFYR